MGKGKEGKNVREIILWHGSMKRSNGRQMFAGCCVQIVEMEQGSEVK